MGKSPLWKILIEAEAAANSAAIQLMSFKDTMEEEFAVRFLFVCVLQNALGLSLGIPHGKLSI